MLTFTVKPFFLRHNTRPDFPQPGIQTRRIEYSIRQFSLLKKEEVLRAETLGFEGEEGVASQPSAKKTKDFHVSGVALSPFAIGPAGCVR